MYLDISKLNPPTTLCTVRLYIGRCASAEKAPSFLAPNLSNPLSMGLTAPSYRGAMAPKENSITRYSQTRRNDLSRLPQITGIRDSFLLLKNGFLFAYVRKRLGTSPSTPCDHMQPHHINHCPNGLFFDIWITRRRIHGSVTSHRSIYGGLPALLGEKNSTAVPMNLACYVSSDSRLSLIVTSILPG